MATTTADNEDLRESLHAIQRERRTKKTLVIALIPIGLLVLLLATLLAYTQTPGQDQKDVVEPDKMGAITGKPESAYE